MSQWIAVGAETIKKRAMSTQKSSSEIDWEYVCTNCHRGFNASMAHQIHVVDETKAELMCSWCKHTDTYGPPDLEEIERPPAIVGHVVGTDGGGYPIARLFFEGGAWLQYRKASDGWVYEEMFTAEGESVASFKAEFERDDCDTPQEYVHREIDRYRKYTARGLGIQRSHIATILIDD